jgi:hypothetical protein
LWKRYGKYGGKVGWIVIRFGKILKIHKKIVKWYRKCGRKVGWIVKWYEKYGRKVSWKVKWYGKYGRKTRRIVISFGQYGRKLWKDMKKMEER